MTPMLVRDWMQPDPVVVASDTLVSEANRILSQNKLHALPVVDDGKLRGLVTRANLLPWREVLAKEGLYGRYLTPTAAPRPAEQ